MSSQEIRTDVNQKIGVTMMISVILLVQGVCVIRAGCYDTSSPMSFQRQPIPPEREAELPDEQRLVRKLFRTYDSTVRPVFNASHNVVVKFGITLIQIMDMDEKNQVLVVNVWLIQEWRDERINWNASDFNGLWKIRIPAKILWLPDIVLYNNADDYTTGYMPSNAMVESNGNVFWSPPARLRSSCKVDISYFPFDIQHCKLKFGSWTYDKSQMDMVKIADEVAMDSYVGSGEWEVYGTTILRNEVQYPIGDEVYPDVTVTLTISRRILYYIINIIFPCVWLNFLSLLAFCLPPDAGEKVTLGITVLLSYSVFMLLVAESMPQTSEYLPLIGIYITVSMCITSISVILTVFILKLHHCSAHQRPVPNWVRRLVLENIACCCFMRRRTRPASNKRRRGSVADLAPNLNNHDQQNHIELLTRLVGHDPSDGVNAVKFTPGYKSPRCSRRVTFTEFADSNHCGEEKEAESSPLDEILKYLRLMVLKRDEDDDQTNIINEWREVASVMDRFFFLIFLVLLISSIGAFLVYIPLVRPSWYGLS